jgi:hypothetical protein
VGVVESLAAEVEASGSSCDAFEGLLDAWVARERATIARLIDELDEAELSDVELARLDERLTAAFEVIVHQASACAAHDGAQRAFAEFDAVIEGS